MDTKENTPHSEVDLNQILRDLDVPWSGILPVAAIRAAQKHRELVIPGLIQAIQDAATETRAGRPPEGNAHFYALFLLTEFQAKEALPAILDAISLPGEGPFDLFGDAVTENLNHVLATLAADSLETIDSLIKNTSLNEYVRWEAAQAYLCLVRDGLLSRDESVDRLRNHLREAITNRDALLAEGLVAELVSYSPHEAEAEIREAFRLGLVDTMMVDTRDLDRSLAEGEERFEQELEYCRQDAFTDTVVELESWASFREQPEQRPHISPNAWQRAADLDGDLAMRDVPTTIRNTTERIGRNEPCPCGSGRKYKKCCGAA